MQYKLSLPDLTGWNNYDKNALKSTYNYNLINFLNNDNNNFDNFELSLDDLSPEEYNDIDNLIYDYEFIGEKSMDKLNRFYNLENLI